MIVIPLILWYLIGFASFIYWWTRDFPFTVVEMPVAILAGLGGPFAFIVGYFIHRDDRLWRAKK